MRCKGQIDSQCLSVCHVIYEINHILEVNTTAMHVSRIGLSMLLFALYANFFGRYFVEKYFRGGVIITRDEEKAEEIKSPGELIIMF